MEDYLLKHSGEDIDALLDKVEGLVEDTSDLDVIRRGADKGDTSVQGVLVNNKHLTPDGKGNISLPNIPAEEDIANMGFTKNKGTVTGVMVNGESKSPNSAGVVDLGNIESAGDIPIYIADFTIESLRAGMNNGAQIDCDIQALVTAMNANKIILVREGVDSSYKGGYVLNGYAEDLLYFSIVDSQGSVLYCDGTNYTSEQYIDGRTLYLQHWEGKQDALVSGKNIKTINGESIVGGGDITVATMSEVNTAIANAITNAINASY